MLSNGGGARQKIRCLAYFCFNSNLVAEDVRRVLLVAIVHANRHLPGILKLLLHRL